MYLGSLLPSKNTQALFLYGRYTLNFVRQYEFHFDMQLSFLFLQFMYSNLALLW